MILTFLGFLYALGMVYAQYPEIMAYNLNLAIFELHLTPLRIEKGSPHA